MTNLIWETATGYDLFVSLHVLQNPDEFALRGAWAKGVRARLPADARDFLEQTGAHLLTALPWVYRLEGKKDASNILAALAHIPAEQRFVSLLQSEEVPAEIQGILDRIAARGAWSDEDRKALAATGKPISQEDMAILLDLWAGAGEYGQRVLPALEAYYEVFFREEEGRIGPALEESAARGREMAQELPLHELFSELSQGIRFEKNMLTYPEWVMAPTFWITPRILVTKIGPERGAFFYGGRPDDASLVPGEAVPDALFLALKALADPTRLRILHYLEEEPQTPSELARTLRLRAPTVIHHLNSLRLAGLVYVTFGKGDKRYAARTSRVAEVYLQLRRYLGITESMARDELSGRPPYVA